MSKRSVNDKTLLSLKDELLSTHQTILLIHQA
jgi:hypothetical protein